MLLEQPEWAEPINVEPRVFTPSLSSVSIEQSEIVESEKRDKETIFEEENKEADEEAEIFDN